MRTKIITGIIAALAAAGLALGLGATAAHASGSQTHYAGLGSSTHYAG